MDKDQSMNRQWLEILATGLSAVGALVAIAGAMLVLSSQSAGAGDSIWPLPGFVMIDWAIFGVLGFLSAYLGSKPLPEYWAKATWFTAGALIPLMVLGALSIGPYVLISLVFLSASAVLVTIVKRLKGRDIFGALALGIVLNLGLLLGLIVLGRGI